MNNYFSTNDYLRISPESREIVDNWLRDNDLLTLGVSFIQLSGDGQSLILSGPDNESSEAISEYDLTVLRILEGNTFPWEVLENLASEVASSENS